MEENIQIHRKVAGYTVIQNSLIRDTTISPNARILMITMLSLPNDFKITVKGICSIINGDDNEYRGYSLKSIYALFQELQQAGYIVKEQQRDENGHFKYVKYHVYEEKLSFENNEEPQVEPSCDTQKIQNIPQKSSNLSEISAINSMQDGSIGDSKKRIDEELDFRDLCKISQNKNNLVTEQGKIETYQSYQEVLFKGYSSQEILVAWANYQDEMDRQPQYMPQLKKWLINESENYLKNNLRKFNTQAKIIEKANLIYKKCNDSRFDENKRLVMKYGKFQDKEVGMYVWVNTPQAELDRRAKEYFENNRF